MKKKLLWSAGIFLALLLSVYIAFGIKAGEGALHPPRLHLTQADMLQFHQIAAANHATAGDVTIQAADGIPLRAWTLVPAQSNGNAILLLHGHQHNRAMLLDRAELFLRHGYAVLLPDARDHGESGGQIATFGVLESSDVRRWYDWMAANLRPHCIDGYGTSMGAAGILEAMRTTPGFCAVVADSPFDSFREASYERMGQMFGTGDWLGRTLLRPVIDIGSLEVRLRYGINMEEASPDRAVAETTIPVLLVHGTSDTNLPIRHSLMILADNQQRKPALAFWKVPGAEHCEAIKVDPAGFEQRVVSWFDQHR
ncbi:alpha/beta hydrolase [Telmatobacter bradus]|uniref:alpha/beta hydrolase n=1 Tax=Telmatobacter bradus TaxID=474953 RepID=UPI003B4289CB